VGAAARWCPGKDPARWLFSDAGTPWHDNRATYLWRRASGGAGIEGVSLHNLRPFYASGLIAAGCDVVTVQRALGHASATTTLNTYAHLWPSAEDRTRAAAGPV
jgi:integrase